MAKKIMSKKEMLKEQQRIKREKRQLTEETKKEDIISSLLKITIGVCLFLFVIYAGMNILKGNWKLGKDEVVVDDTISNGVICGTILKQQDPEYFIMAYSHSSDGHNLYEGLISSYQGPNKVYDMDLDSGLNKQCVGEKTVVNNDVSKLKLTSPTLLSIKNRKIEKAYTKQADIIKALSSN